MSTLQGITRREALKKTLLFTTGFLTAGQFARLRAAPPATDFSGSGIHLLAIRQKVELAHIRSIGAG